jgi:hypothetical protein
VALILTEHETYVCKFFSFFVSFKKIKITKKTDFFFFASSKVSFDVQVAACEALLEMSFGERKHLEPIQVWLGNLKEWDKKRLPSKTKKKLVAAGFMRNFEEQ